MKKNTLLKTVTALGLSLAMIATSASMCFATQIQGQPSGTTPAYMTVPATSVDFTISERIDMTGTENSTDLTVTDLTITNNAKVGTLNVDKIEAKAEPGWTVVADTTDFKKLPKDTKKFSMVADGTHDLANAYENAGEVSPAGSDTTNIKTVKFTGKTGIKTTPINDTKVANVVTTVSFA